LALKKRGFVQQAHYRLRHNHIRKTHSVLSGETQRKHPFSTDFVHTKMGEGRIGRFLPISKLQLSLHTVF
jgi:hypothetical protein